MLNGKCAACDTDISIRYPIIELLTGVLTAAVAWLFGFGWEALAAICITWVLIVISAIDIDQKHIYDDMVLPFLWSGLLISVISNNVSIAIPISIDSKVTHIQGVRSKDVPCLNTISI